ncbi:hypothetical protein LTS08_006635 [Lithohypha guttulata]|nr:hypothetical protein LTS08_006635 [Lithohypha guttulata]
MANTREVHSPQIAPPVVIVICIAGAVVLVILIAALSRLCRRVRADADEDQDNKAWNPNRRNPDQDKYMEGVRWRTNAEIWQTAYNEDYRRGWYRDFIEERRIQRDVGWTSVGLDSSSGGGTEQSGEVSAEEFLTYANDNPYQDLLDKRSKETSQGSNLPTRSSPTRNPPVIRLDNVESAVVQGHTDKGYASLGDEHIVNDESQDVVDTHLPSNSLYAPRQSRMLRSSSVYSGDALLPSSHLHLVHSSSKYALGQPAGPKDAQTGNGAGPEHNSQREV